ncbi:MAG: winged helix-turn-helix transcriptional regulator [Methanoregula sp.]|nr:winged helix-turn-helix transcriptional regulator [Methanoregula sp.]
MGKLNLTVVFCMVFLVSLALFPIACPFATMGAQNTLIRHSIPGATGCGMCARMQNQQNSRAVPTSPATGQPMQSSTSTFFRCEIMSNLQNVQTGMRRRLSGIKRILRNNVCENKNRKTLYDLILAHSGIDHAELLKRTGLNKETLRYHLAVLAALHKVSAVRDGGIFYYFENNGAFAMPEQKIAIHMRSSTTRTILGLLEQRPGIHQTELAGILGVTAPTIIWHIRKLERDGFVQEERQGKTIRYTLTPTGVMTLGKFRNRVPSVASSF